VAKGLLDSWRLEAVEGGRGRIAGWMYANWRVRGWRMAGDRRIEQVAEGGWLTSR
jgi:hypothetical protein